MALKSLEEQLVSARRELGMRNRVYQKWVDTKRMTEGEMWHEIYCMESIIRTLELLSATNAIPLSEVKKAHLKSNRPKRQRSLDV